MDIDHTTEATPTYPSPKEVAAAFYASYNGDLAAGFERYISKELVLHGFDGPNQRDAWIDGDIELTKSLSGYRLEILDQFAEGPKVVTRWRLGGLHTGTILGIPASGREVSARSARAVAAAPARGARGRRSEAVRRRASAESAGAGSSLVAPTPDRS